MIEIVISSGDRYDLAQIGLYDSTRVSANTLRQRAAAKLGGTSSGIGFMGSPGWVVGGSLALGVIEGFANKSAAREGIELVAEAQRLTAKLRAHVVFFDIGSIEHSDLPYPDNWWAQRHDNVEYDLATIPLMRRGEFLAKHDIRKDQIVANHVAVRERRNYIHDGSEFIPIRTNTCERAIRWIDVVSYRAISQQESSRA